MQGLKTLQRAFILVAAAGAVSLIVGLGMRWWVEERGMGSSGLVSSALSVQVSPDDGLKVPVDARQCGFLIRAGSSFLRPDLQAAANLPEMPRLALVTPAQVSVAVPDRAARIRALLWITLGGVFLLAVIGVTVSLTGQRHLVGTKAWAGVSPENARRLKRAASWAAAAVFLLGALVLAGWIALPPLPSFLSGDTKMKPNTAAGLMLAAVSLALLNRETKSPRVVAGKILAALVLLLGLVTATEYWFNFDLGIDGWVDAVPPEDAQNPFPWRMSPVSVFCFVCVGLGLFFLDARKRSATILSEVASVGTVLAALLGLIGYTYGATTFHRIGPFSPMAVHTALAFLALGCAILAARPERGLVALLTRGTSGSVLARRLLPAAFVIPLVLGWLRVKGEQAGHFELPIGTALLVISLVVIFVALIWRTAVSLDRSDLARQQTETALGESEGRYRSLFESIDEGFCVIEVLFDERQTPVDYRFLEINPAFERHSGLVGAVGKRMRELIPNHDQHWFETYGRVAMTGEPARFENYSDPMQRWFDVYAFRLSPPEERKLAILFNNITDRKRAETARQRLAAIVESSEDAIISKDLNGIITTWNVGAERLLGYSAVEAVGQPVTMLIPADHAEEESRIINSIRAGETFTTYETVRRHKEGRLIDVSLTVSPIKSDDGRIIGASKIMRDITARIKAERELAEKARLLDLSNDAIIARNLDGDITVWNQGAERYYGWKAEEVIGKHMHTLLQTELPKPMPEILEELYQEHSFAAEVVQVARDGRRIPLLCRWALDQEKGSILTSYTDITERLQAERELAEKARLLDLTNDAVIVRDMADRIVFWNKGAEKLFGWTSEEVLGRDLHSLLQTEFPRAVHEIKAELHREGKFTGEVVQIARDGQRIPSLCRWVLDRETNSILTSYTDMSALKQAEEALRGSEKKYRTLFEAMDEGYCILEMLFDEAGHANDWRYLDMNAAFERHNGIAGARGKRIRELVPDIEPKWFEIYGNVALTGKAIRFVEHSEALHRWFDVYAYRVGGPESQDVAVLFTDITQRRQAEDALRESEERMRLATEATGVGIWEWNVLHDHVHWDAEMFRIYGLEPTKDGIVPYSVWSEAVVPEDLETQRAILEETIRQGGHSAREFRIRRQDTKEERRIEAVETVRLNSQGQVEWLVGTNLDITERRKAEEALKRAQQDLQRHAENLEATVAERTATLRETIGELEAFSYSLSHDMRAPLRAMQGFTQLAQDECGEKAGPLLSKVISAAVRLDRMIQDVLSYTRISRQKIQIEPVDVDRLVREIIGERPELQAPRAEVTVEAPLLPLRGHEASLTQCLTNLLGNAVKFVPSDRTPRVKVYTEDGPDTVRLWIEDNGIGIEPQAQQKLFEMFYRVNHEKDYEGTGLGLSIVRKAVERMGGTVGVESEPGRGSRFWVQLPKKTDE